MAESLNPPLSYEASATTTHPHAATELPSEVISCLKNSRFVRPPQDKPPIPSGHSANNPLQSAPSSNM